MCDKIGERERDYMKNRLFFLEDVKVNGILDIKSQEIVYQNITCVLGVSGAGKTTFLRLLNKVISPDEGVVYYKENNLESINSVEHRREVVMLSQKPIMFDKTIQDNLEIGCRYSNKELPSVTKLKSMMEKLQLNKKLSDDVQYCSLGEKQRIALGRVLFMNPEVYLMDEPSSALDKETEKLIIELIVEYTKNNNKTLVMVTHNNDLADRIADDVIIIEKRKSYE
jgi:putative ABC transport system ATP-binding protein